MSPDRLRLETSSCYIAVISESVMRKTILLRPERPTRWYTGERGGGGGDQLHDVSSLCHLPPLRKPTAMFPPITAADWVVLDIMPGSPPLACQTGSVGLWIDAACLLFGCVKRVKNGDVLYFQTFFNFCLSIYWWYLFCMSVSQRYNIKHYGDCHPKSIHFPSLLHVGGIWAALKIVQVEE